VLVDFSAVWCGPCKKLAPIVSEIEQESKGSLKVIRIDVDENPELASALQISSIPLLHIYNKQELVWQNVGLVDKMVITEHLK
jgi:thioredoxin 1